MLVVAAGLVALVGWAFGRSLLSSDETLQDVDAVWSNHDFESLHDSVAAVAGDRLYVTGHLGGSSALIVYDKSSGKERWRYEFASRFPELLYADADVVVVRRQEHQASVLFADGTVVREEYDTLYEVERSRGGLHLIGEFETHRGTDVLTLDPHSGDELWHVAPRGRALYNHDYQIVDGTLYLATTDRLVAVDAITGRRMWHFRFSDLGESQGSLGGEFVTTNVGLALDPDGEVIGFDPATGEVSWREPIPGRLGGGTAELLHADETGIIHGYDGGIRAVDPTGAVRWSIRSADDCSVVGIGAIDGLVMAEVSDSTSLGGNDRHSGGIPSLAAFDIATGEPVWSYATDVLHGHTSILAYRDLLLVVDGRLRILERDTGRARLDMPVTRGSDFRVPGPVLDGDRLYLPANSGTLQALELSDLLAFAERDPNQGGDMPGDISCLEP